jgi:hypothetical protein
MTIERFSSGGPWEQTFGYSRVVRAGELLVTAGCTSTVDGVVAGLLHPDHLVEVEVEAYVGGPA